MEKLLIINPGSTSTKIALYEGEEPVFVESVSHSAEDIAPFERISDQADFRRGVLLATLDKHGVKLADLDAIVSRGGLLPPVQAGAYEINDDMVWQLIHKPVNEHASSLGAIIARELSKEAGIPAYIYDAVTVDEMIPLARYSGLPEIERSSIGHHLNMRAAAMRYAKEQGRPYESCTLVVAHLGGGITVSVHEGGKTIDLVNDEEGPFSPERSGGVPCPPLVRMAFSGQYEQKELLKKLKAQGGLLAYLGTTDAREVEKRIESGDQSARIVYEAMALGVAKSIAAEAAVVAGKVDAVILTGGIAYSDLLTGWIRDRVRFIAPVVVFPGENEMQSLALGGLRVLRGEEKAHTFEKVAEVKKR